MPNVKYGQILLSIDKASTEDLYATFSSSLNVLSMMGGYVDDTLKVFSEILDGFPGVHLDECVLTSNYRRETPVYGTTPNPYRSSRP